jgi:hypothetical protein
LSEVDRLDRVNVLLVKQTQQAKIVLFLELVAFPWLDSIELSLAIGLRALLARQELVIYLLLGEAMFRVTSHRSSIVDTSFLR